MAEEDTAREASQALRLDEATLTSIIEGVTRKMLDGQKVSGAGGSTEEEPATATRRELCKLVGTTSNPFHSAWLSVAIGIRSVWVA